MKDSIKRSLEWLQNLDASEIVDIDTEQIFPELLVENTKTSQESKIKLQLDQVYSKLPKSLPKQNLSKAPISIKSLQDLPQFLALFKEISVMSPDSFQWIKQIEPETETLGIIDACRGVFSNVPSKGIYSGILNWVYEGTNENEWLPSLQSAYLMFATGRSEYFYVSFRRYYCVFLKEMNKSVVYLSNPNNSLINTLKKNLVNIPEQEPDLENLQKKPKKTEIVKIEGKSVHAFYNYLVNSPGDCRIISPQVFLNSQFKLLVNKENCQFNNPFEIPHLQYKVVFAGLATRENVVKLCQVFEATQGTFTMELTLEPGTNQMPGQVPVKLIKRDNNMYDIYL